MTAINFKCTQEHKDLIKKKAEEAGLNLSNYCLNILLRESIQSDQMLELLTNEVEAKNKIIEQLHEMLAKEQDNLRQLLFTKEQDNLKLLTKRDNRPWWQKWFKR